MAQGAIGPRASRLAILSWCLYDFANSPFTTLVVTFIYSVYFASVIVPADYVPGGEDAAAAWGTAVWGWAINGTAVLVALVTPVLGAIADRTRARKRMLALSMVACVGLTTALAFPTKGYVWVAWWLFMAANLFYEVANVFYNALLPSLGPKERLGRISGYGWALGYMGGLLPMVIALGMIGRLPGQETPWVTAEAGWNVRGTNLLVAGWFVIFSIPLLLFVPEPVLADPRRAGGRWTDGFVELARTFQQVRRYRHTFRFLVARILYNDALVTIFAMAGLYARVTFDMEFGEIMLLGIWLNVVAGTGAFALGFLDDYIGGKRTILLTLVLLLASVVGAFFARTQIEFWFAATLLGAMVGPNQSSSRALMGRFVPPNKEGEFFGFFAFSGKATNWLGVFAFSWVTYLTGQQRPAVLTVAGFLLLGLVLLLFVDEAEGKRQAEIEPTAS
ncbi:MAG: MFS transporter [Pirellulales bacterium]